MDNLDGLNKTDKYAIDTFTGKWVNPENVSEGDISIYDIAHSLSLLCRFTGHCKWFYSVGQHSINVAYILGKRSLGFDYETKDNMRLTMLAGLLHDAAEAYMGDIARPIKALFSKYTRQIKEVEDRLMGVIVKKFGLSGADWQYVKKADNLMVVTEAYQLMPDNLDEWDISETPIVDFPAIGIARPEDIEGNFLSVFEKLRGAM
jgi:hypothetical protein